MWIVKCNKTKRFSISPWSLDWSVEPVVSRPCNRTLLRFVLTSDSHPKSQHIRRHRGLILLKNSSDAEAQWSAFPNVTRDASFYKKGNDLECQCLIFIDVNLAVLIRLPELCHWQETPAPEHTPQVTVPAPTQANQVIYSSRVLKPFPDMPRRTKLICLSSLNM